MAQATPHPPERAWPLTSSGLLHPPNSTFWASPRGVSSSSSDAAPPVAGVTKAASRSCSPAGVSSNNTPLPWGSAPPWGVTLATSRGDSRRI